MSIMNIVGILVILILPYMAGYIINKAFSGKKETNQIETYLIGFFFLFLLQGAVFTGALFLDKPYMEACKMFGWLTDVIIVLFLLLFVITGIFKAKGKNEATNKSSKLKKEEWILISATIIALAGIILRIVLLRSNLRIDGMLSTVREIVSSRELFTVNPFTNQPYGLGVINSRKIISLPAYYAYYAISFGIDLEWLLYVVITLQTVTCTFFACTLTLYPIVRNRKKSMIFILFLAVLILSGDYFSGSIIHKILHNGYSGAAIVAGVMLPYCMYVITDMYRREREGGKWLGRIGSVSKMLLCLAASLFLTSFASGGLLIIIVAVVLGTVCMIRFAKEEV